MLKDEIPGHDLFLAIRAQGVNARQIHHGMIGALNGAGFLIYSHPGEIAYMLVGAGEGVEKGGFAAVLVAG